MPSDFGGSAIFFRTFPFLTAPVEVGDVKEGLNVLILETYPALEEDVALLLVRYIYPSLSKETPCVLLGIDIEYVLVSDVLPSMVSIVYPYIVELLELSDLPTHKTLSW